MSSTNLTAYEDHLNWLQQQSCAQWEAGYRTSYRYIPSFAAGIIFCILFAIPLFYHLFQFCRLRSTMSILLALGAVTELIGWAARAYQAKCPYNGDAFMAQEVTLIIAPVFFSAMLYVLLGKLIIDLGPRSSAVSAKWYAIIFCSCDVASLVVQAVGGAKAASADTTAEEDVGTHIMVGGIAFQLLTMTLFGGFVADFFKRVLAPNGAFRGAVTRGMKMVFVALVVSFLMIYIRSIYRTIELAQGWHGYLITHEGYFIGLDATIMVIAVGVFVVFDPAVIFRGEGRPGFMKKARNGGSLDSNEEDGSFSELALREREPERH